MISFIVVDVWFFGHLASGFAMFVFLCSFFHSVTLVNTVLIFLDLFHGYGRHKS